jgi:hypothetical protein
MRDLRERDLASFDPTLAKLVKKLVGLPLANRVGVGDDGDDLDVARHQRGDLRQERGATGRPHSKAGRLIDRQAVLNPLGDREAEKIVWRRKDNGTPRGLPMVSLSGFVSALPLPSGFNNVR